jgi:GNAT superfamily N-acetyltransferase
MARHGWFSIGQMAESFWITRPVELEDLDAWRRLFTGYCEFYERTTTENQLARVWSWIHEEKLIDAIVVVSDDDPSTPVGLAHLRSWIRPLRGEIAGYLDDLFVSPDARGTGATEALFEAIEDLAIERDWSIVRWTTADDNYRARGAYERVATRTGWITYEMSIERPAG